MVRFCVCLSALLLAGCAQVPKIEPAPSVTLTPQQTKLVQDGVRRALKDPESARFGTILGGRDPKTGVILVCGQINAKNSLGGYTGNTPFTGALGEHEFVVQALGGDEIVTLSISQVCSARGMGV